MGEYRRRQAKTEGKKDKWDYEDRATNIYGHEMQTLKTREELQRRGVKNPGDGADIRMDKPERTMRKSAKVKR